MNDHLSPIQKRLLETFHFFGKFCEDHSLTYYAASGTCLGAIRHKGFIPWDDDIDLLMLRKDYDRLLGLRDLLKSESGGAFDISDIVFGNHPWPFAKFYSTRCTIWEMKQFPVLMGPWIDIFPVDEWNESQQVSLLYDHYNLCLWNYRKALSHQTWHEIYGDIVQLNGLEGPIKIVKQCLYKPLRNHYFRKCKGCLDSIKQVHGKQLKCWSLVKNEVYEKEWFSDARVMPFEDTSILVPAGSEPYLSMLFRDYMTPPPESKRMSNHEYYFIDLERKWTMEEIMASDISKAERKGLSFRVIMDEIKHRHGFTR